jgi:hypothetical protein
MKMKLLISVAMLLTLASIGFAQSKKAKPANPNVIVKRLYKAQKAGTGPFFQTKSRAVVDKYFTKSLADLIWKDAVEAKGEVGLLDFDPLYGSQDPRPTDFVIMDTGWGGDAKFGPDNEAVVQVTFKTDGKEQMVSFRFHQQKSKIWKIYDIRYPGEAKDTFLKEILSAKM